MEYRLGIDIGGTNTAWGVVDASGQIVLRGSVPTTAYGGESVDDYITRLCGNILAAADEAGLTGRILSAGVGAPCVNSTTGCIEAATNLPWPSPIALADLLGKALGIPVKAANDANAAAAGEHLYGAARGVDNFLMITLGTGVGGAAFVDGHLLNGRSGFATELGHIAVPEGEGRVCACGRKDCLQCYCSASGVVDTAIQKMEKFWAHTALSDVPREEITCKTIGTLATEKDDFLCRQVWKQTGEVLGRALAGYAAFTDPEKIILFGGVTNVGDLLLQATIEAFNEHALHLYAGKVKIEFSQLPQADAAILGASAL